MTLKIHKIIKKDLSKDGTLDLISCGISNSSSMTISHYAYSFKQTESTIPFSIEVVKEHTPYIDNIDFCIVVRTKVDLTAVGPNSNTIEDIGADLGEYNYVRNVPSRTLDLPPGFTQLYGK